MELSPADQAMHDLPYSEGSPEMAASRYFRVRYRAWVIANVPMSKTEAINGGAETVGCNPLTAARYLAMLTSAAGPLRTVQDERGTITITTKKEGDWKRSEPK